MSCARSLARSGSIPTRSNCHGWTKYSACCLGDSTSISWLEYANSRPASMAKLNGIFREQHSLSAKKLRTMFGVKV